MKIGFLQFNPVFGDVNKNLNRVASLIDNITCDLLVLPELFSTGYTFKNKKELKNFSETVPNGKTIAFLREIAREKKMAVVGGFAERDGRRIFNSSVLCREDGKYFIYRKKHLYYREKGLFNNDYEPYKVLSLTNGVKVGLIICFDWIFPEAIRSLALEGAQIICHSANLVMPYCQDAMVTRALENRVFVITANRTGTEKRGRLQNHFTGISQIVSPKGRILAKAGEFDDVISVVNINPDDAKNKLLNPLNNIFNDRRTDIY